MIISVDTGNKHMKTENCEFNSGVEILDTLPGELEEVIEYEGKYYMTTNRRISYMEDKTADDRYYILTLFAIAKELSYREKNEGLLPQNLQEIELLVGLPPAHYGKQRKKFREYFYRNGAVVEFCYKGISYRIVFKEVKSLYTGICRILSSCCEETVIGNTKNFINRYWWLYRRLYGFKIWTAGNGVCRFIRKWCHSVI